MSSENVTVLGEGSVRQRHSCVVFIHACMCTYAHMYTCVCVSVSVCQDCVHQVCFTSPNVQEDVLSEVAKSEADVISYLDQINRCERTMRGLMYPNQEGSDRQLFWWSEYGEK